MSLRKPAKLGRISAIAQGVDRGISEQVDRVVDPIRRKVNELCDSLDQVSGFVNSTISSIDYTTWYISQKPVEPHEMDDEFEGGAGGWSNYNTWSATAIDPYSGFAGGGARENYNDNRPSWWMFQPPADAPTEYAKYKHWASAPLNYTVWARFTYNHRSAGVVNNDNSIYLGLYDGTDPSTANGVRLFLCESDLDTCATESQKVTAGVAATIQNGSNEKSSGPDIGYVLIHHLWDPSHLPNPQLTAYFWVISTDGAMVYLGTTTHTVRMNYVFIGVRNASTAAPGNMVLGCDFVRFRDGISLP